METVRHGNPVTVTGRIRAVVYTPTEHVPTLQAELYDGSGSMTLVWLGRRRIAGIEPGRRLVATGRVGSTTANRPSTTPSTNCSALRERAEGADARLDEAPAAEPTGDPDTAEQRIDIRETVRKRCSGASAAGAAASSPRSPPWSSSS